MRHAHERVVKPGVEQGLLLDRRLIIIVIGQRAQTRDLVVGRGADDVAADVRLEHVAQVEHISSVPLLSANSAHSGRLIDCSGVFVMYEPLLDALYDAHGSRLLIASRTHVRLTSNFVARDSSVGNLSPFWSWPWLIWSRTASTIFL